MLYTLNWYSVICQLYFNKTGNKNKPYGEAETEGRRETFPETNN